MKLKSYLPLITMLSVINFVQAQVFPSPGAIKTGAKPTGILQFGMEDSSRSLEENEVSSDLDMLRLTISYQGEVMPGVSPWVEAGWHDPELASAKTGGGFTWGVGIQVRPYLWPLRNDPVLGPRDWLALTFEVAARGGEADIRADETTLEWRTLESILGMEWHKKFLGRENGPSGSYDITSGAGLILNRTEATRGSFDGSEESPVGFRFYSGFSFGIRNFTRLEVDLFGSADRRIHLTAGFRF